MNPNQGPSSGKHVSGGFLFGWSGKSFPRGLNRLLLSPVVVRWPIGRLLPSFLIFLHFAVQSVGCAPQTGSPSPDPGSRSNGQLFESGDEVFGSGAAQGGASNRSADPKGTEPLGEWSIALMTVSGSDHRAIATSARRDMIERFQILDASFVDDIKGGSGVFYGRFRAPSDPAFREAMKQIRALTMSNGQPAFLRAIPARPESSSMQSLDPHDLRSLRAQIGRRHPVYTLQVAQWGAFGDDRIDYRALRTQAEGYTRTLRRQGHDAWFSHNEGLRMSSVNVGTFGADAYDPRSTLFSPEVELVMGQFPYLLVNGEYLLDPRTARNQTPFLVEVPR